MKKLKIYLAGKMGGLTFSQMNDWRYKLKNKLISMSNDVGEGITVINPVDYYNFEIIRHQSEEEVEDYDLAHVTSSDIVIVSLEGLNSSIGTIIELHDAHYHKRIPVLAFGYKNEYDKLHPWIKRDITRVEESIDDIVNYIKEFYLI
jgi:nucleoside 2-deoxyribosyltransferase